MCKRCVYIISMYVAMANSTCFLFVVRLMFWYSVVSAGVTATKLWTHAVLCVGSVPPTHKPSHGSQWGTRKLAIRLSTLLSAAHMWFLKCAASMFSVRCSMSGRHGGLCPCRKFGKHWPHNGSPMQVGISVCLSHFQHQ